MKLKIIISMLLITSCTSLNVTPTICPEFYTYICEGTGSRADCWCEHTRQLEEKLKLIQQQSYRHQYP
jgi:hypothetical protein